MKRNLIIQKLMNEGFSEKTLVNFTDKQLLSLSERLLGEATTSVSKTTKYNPTELKGKGIKVDGTVTFNQDGSVAVTGDMKEELKGNQKKIDANKNGKIDKEDFKLLKKKKEVKEDSWDSKSVAKGFKKIGSANKKKGYRPNYDNMSLDDTQSGKLKDDFYTKLSKAKYNPEKGELEIPDKIDEAKKEKWIQKAIHPSKKGSLKKALGVKKDETIPTGKLKSASKKKGKIGQRARLALTLKKLKEHSESQEWVNKLVENNYHSLTTKNEIMELIQSKLNESETLVPMPKKGKKGHNGVPEFMTYDSIKSSEPTVAPTKPVTKPTTTPNTTPKPKTPYQPGPGVNPKPKALSEKKSK